MIRLEFGSLFFFLLSLLSAFFSLPFLRFRFARVFVLRIFHSLIHRLRFHFPFSRFSLPFHHFPRSFLYVFRFRFVTGWAPLLEIESRKLFYLRRCARTRKHFPLHFFTFSSFIFCSML